VDAEEVGAAAEGADGDAAEGAVQDLAAAALEGLVAALAGDAGPEDAAVIAAAESDSAAGLSDVPADGPPTLAETADDATLPNEAGPGGGETQESSEAPAPEPDHSAPANDG
jgi:hypothetical protein